MFFLSRYKIEIEEEIMHLEICDFCGIKFDRIRTVKYKHRTYCCEFHKEEAIDVEAQVNGAGETPKTLEGTYGDNPNTTFPLLDWANNRSRLF